MHNIALYLEDPSLELEAKSIADQFNWPIVNSQQTNHDILLHITSRGISVSSNTLPELKTPWQLDFLSGKLAHRAQQAHLMGEAVVKAVGKRANQALRVVDGTGGFGRDAYLLALVGCDVIMLERSPIIFTLLNDALKRLLKQKNLVIEAYCTDTKTWLAEKQQKLAVDVIYLDPMFPKRRKSAQVKKESQLLQLFAEPALDEKALLQQARMTPCKRVVVKRPRLAPVINEEGLSGQMTTKTCRFDLYTPA